MMLSGKEKVDKKKSRELFLWDNDLQRPAERSIPQAGRLYDFDKTDRVMRTKFSFLNLEFSEKGTIFNCRFRYSRSKNLK